MMLRQPRQHSEQHLRFIRGLPCCVCQNPIETEAAHVRYASPEYGKRNVGKGERPDDKWAVPLCGRHHREQHEIGEREFWLTVGIDPLRLASDLWSCSGDQESGERVAMSAHAHAQVL